MGWKADRLLSLKREAERSGDKSEFNRATWEASKRDIEEAKNREKRETGRGWLK
jgi:hypothetical protein